ncbi:SAST synthase, partial [Rhinopomastus cyanomelas]|nr:SAST synthase [Rhinopomastus cyanomelas]
LVFFLGMERVICCLYKKPDALCRLICFPWAGGGTCELAQWGELFSSSVEVSCVRFPGRETRRHEPPVKDVAAIAKEIESVCLKELQEKPFAFFGHSFGGYIAAAVALHLKENCGLEPIHLFVSGAHAPSVTLQEQANHIGPMTDEEIGKVIQLLGGISPQILQNEDMKKDLMHNFREDARVFQTFSFKAKTNTPFSCDITFFNGSEEKQYEPQAWQSLTSGDVSSYEFPGGHFYLLEPSNLMALIKHMERCIECA